MSSPGEFLLSFQGVLETYNVIALGDPTQSDVNGDESAVVPDLHSGTDDLQVETTSGIHHASVKYRDHDHDYDHEQSNDHHYHFNEHNQHHHHHVHPSRQLLSINNKQSEVDNIMTHNTLQYPWVILADSTGTGLIIMGRDVNGFRDQYEQRVLIKVAEMGFSGAKSKPMRIDHGGECGCFDTKLQGK
jgi:hypothetical protein